MTESNNDQTLQDIATVFFCHPSMAVAITDRIREKVGRPVSNEDILRVMKTITPSRLSVDTVVAKLEKLPQRKPRAQAAKPARGKQAGNVSDTPGPATQQDESPAAKRARASLQEQLETVLADNWTRATTEKLATPQMSVGELVKAVRQYTGYKDAPLRRILRAAISLDREDVMLTPNIVADRVNQMVMNGDINE